MYVRPSGITLTPSMLEYSTDGGQSFMTAAISGTALAGQQHLFEITGLAANFDWVAGVTYYLTVLFTDGTRAYDALSLTAGRAVVRRNANWVPVIDVVEDIQLHVEDFAETDKDVDVPFSKLPIVRYANRAAWTAAGAARAGTIGYWPR